MEPFVKDNWNRPKIRRRGIAHKITTCSYSKCNEQWPTRGSKADGPRKYCIPHGKIMFKVTLKKAQKAYRKRLPKEVISKRNAIWRKNNPEYNKNYYAKRRLN